MPRSPRERRRPLIALLAALAALCLAPSSARAHAFQTNLYPDIQLNSNDLSIELWIITSLFPPLEHLDFRDGKPRPSAEEARESIESYFAATCPITVNGIARPPALMSLSFEEIEGGDHLGAPLDFTFAKMRLIHPFAGEAKTVKLRWGIWFPDGAIEVVTEEGEQVTHDPNVLDTLIFLPGDQYPIYLTKADPEVIWHKPPEEFGDASLVVAPAPPPPPPAKRIARPTAATFICLALTPIVFFGLPFLPRPVRAMGAVALLVGAFLSFDLPPAEIETPMTAATAEDEFLRLHRGIYRAFEADSEDAIYNRLAASVDGPLLDRLYQEVYQSLIDRQDGGGALSRVASVDYIATEAKPDEASGGWLLQCTWRVHGIVRHWGHAHRRSNEYQADYILAPRGEGWKIAAAVVNLQKRVPAPDPSTNRTESDASTGAANPGA